jgi:hypothetical protein
MPTADPDEVIDSRPDRRAAQPGEFRSGGDGAQTRRLLDGPGLGTVADDPVAPAQVLPDPIDHRLDVLGTDGAG